MSRRPSSARQLSQLTHAPVFAALGDETRLLLLGKLRGGGSLSISDLSEGSRLTRQAITKHLRVLEDVSLVHGARRGRKMLFNLTPRPIGDARSYLDLVSSQWEQALARLKSHVESGAAIGPA
jgi:DNA-binding transcriptional ArsR family regulator